MKSKRYKILFILLLFPFISCETTSENQNSDRYSMSDNEMDNKNPDKQEDMLELSLLWGRLAPLPQNIENFKIQTQGSRFTRGFTFTFNASQKNIKLWLNKCDSFLDCKIEKVDDNTTRYLLKPEGDASFTVLVIYWNKGEVYFNTYWS